MQPNGIHLLPQQAQPQLHLAAPINDVQLVALIAAQIYSAAWRHPDNSAEKAVAAAVDILAEACVRGNDAVERLVRELRAGKQ